MNERPDTYIDDDEDGTIWQSEPTPVALVEDSNHRATDAYRDDENTEDAMIVVQRW